MTYAFNQFNMDGLIWFKKTKKIFFAEKPFFIIQLKQYFQMQPLLNPSESLNPNPLIQQTTTPTKICKYYVVRKKRFCKFQVMKGSQFCRLHCSDVENRIMCPYQNGTYVTLANYENHLKVCPKYQQKMKQENSEWFTKDINTTKNQPTKQQQCTIKQLLEHEEFMEFIPKLLDVFFRVFEKEEHGPWYYIDMTEEKYEDSKSTDKDQIQCDLILNLIQKYNLKSLKNIYVEFGAGKGLLSSTIAKSFDHGLSKHILLQMQSRRNKADMFHRENPYFQRFRSNVGDFTLSKTKTIMIDNLKSKNKYKQQQIEEFTQELSDCKLVGVCKHMCGMATDLSISAMKNASKQIPIAGTVMATCCHHRCSYQTFENIKYFEGLGFTSTEISYIFKISSWGVMRNKEPKWHPKHDAPQFISCFKKQKGEKFSEVERQMIGKVCKRMIDKARQELMKEFELRVDFVRYCDYEVTPENFVLICY